MPRSRSASELGREEKALLERLDALAYIEPTQDLKYCLENAAYHTARPIAELRALPFARLHHLRSPSDPFGKPNEQSRKAVKAGKIIIPGTGSEAGGYAGLGKGKSREVAGVETSISATDEQMALLFSDKFAIDEVEAVLLWWRYRNSEASGVEDGTSSDSGIGRSRVRRGVVKSAVSEGITRIFSFYMLEIRAICELAASVIRHSSIDPETEDDALEVIERREVGIYKLCVSLRREMTGDDSGAYLRSLFRQFASMAQVRAPMAEGREIANLWAIHYLKTQVSLLEAMYLYIYYGPDFISGATTSNIIAGVVMSSFGTMQANSRILEGCAPEEVAFMVSKIEALLGAIAIESLGLTLLLNRPQDIGIPSSLEAHDAILEEERRLCQSTGAIADVHRALSGAPPTAANTRVFPLVLLGWSYILKMVPTFMVPGQRGAEALQSEMDAEGRATMYERPAGIACQPQQRMLEKWQELLSGPLLCESVSLADIDKNAALYKDSMNVLFRAFAQVVTLSRLPDIHELKRVWCLLYGQGDPGSVRELCVDFWSSVEADPSRAELLTHSWFPFNPEGLPAMLNALTGAGSVLTRYSGAEDSDSWPAECAYGYLDRLEFMVTNTVQSQSATAELLLPGMPEMSVSKPRLLSRPDTTPYANLWHLQGSGVALLLSVMSAAVDQDAELLAEWRKLGVEVGDAFVETCLIFIDNLSGANSNILAGMLEHKLPKEMTLVDVVTSSLTGMVRNLGSAYNPRMFSSATTILCRLLESHVGRVMSWLSETKFFGQNGVAAAVCRLEQVTGVYTGTRAILDVIKALLRVAGAGHYTAGQGWLKEKVAMASLSLQFLHKSIWTQFTSWSFADPLENSRILTVAADIYTLAFAQCSLAEPDSMLRQAYSVVTRKFLVTAAPLDLDPILYVLEGRDALFPGDAPGHFVALRARELTLRSILALVDVVLADCDSAFKGALLNRSPVDGGCYIMDRLVQIAVSAHADTAASVAAALGLLRISQLASTYSHADRGLARCFLDPTAAIGSIRHVLADPTADSALRTALWQALAEFSSSTPSLAYLCAGRQQKPADEGQQDGFGQSDIRGTMPAVESETSTLSTPLDIAILEIQGFSDSWQTAPDRLLAAIEFLRSIFIGNGEILSGLLSEERTDLWKALEAIARKQSSSSTLDLSYASETGRAYHGGLPRYHQVRCQRLARAAAIAIVWYGSSSLEGPDIGDEQTPDVRAQSGVNLVKEVESLRTLANDASLGEEDVDAAADATEIVQRLYPGTSIDGLLRRWCSRELTRCANQDTWLDVVAGLLGNPELDTDIMQELQRLSALWIVADANEKLSSEICGMLSGLADLLHAQPQYGDAITKAAAECSLELVADLPLRRFKGLAADYRAARTINICADLLELSSIQVSLVTRRWSSALSHLTHSLPSVPWGSQIARDDVVDRDLRTGLHTILIYVLSAQPAYDAGAEADSAVDTLCDFLDALAVPWCQSLFYAIERGMTRENADTLADLEILASIIALTWQKRDPRNRAAWLVALDNHGIISHALNLLIRGFSTADRLSGENIYASVILRILASIAQVPGGAMRLVSSGIIRALDMTLTIRQAESGRLRPHDASQGYAAWTSMLDLLARLLSSLPNARGWADDLLPFLNKATPQFLYSCFWDVEADDCLARLTETQSAVCIMRQVIGLLDRTQIEDSLAFCNAAQLLTLLAAVTTGLSSQRTLKAVLEREAFEAEAETGAAQQDLCLINDSLLATGSDIVQVLSTMTRASTIVCGDQESWRAVGRLALPVRIHKTSSIRILTNFLVVLSDSEELEAPDSADIAGSPVTQNFAPLNQDTRKTLVDATADRTWLVCVAQAVMTAQVSAAEKERIRAAKAEGRDDKVEARKVEVRLDSIDIKALSSASTRPTKSLMWNACSAFLREHVEIG